MCYVTWMRFLMRTDLIRLRVTPTNSGLTKCDTRNCVRLFLFHRLQSVDVSVEGKTDEFHEEPMPLHPAFLENKFTSQLTFRNIYMLIWVEIDGAAQVAHGPKITPVINNSDITHVLHWVFLLELRIDATEYRRGSEDIHSSKRSSIILTDECTAA